MTDRSGVAPRAPAPVTLGGITDANRPVASALHVGPGCRPPGELEDDDVVIRLDLTDPTTGA